ncbi:MAG: hypothetical protein JSR73_10105 [Proteobacteria bacterium]|nr:hypothetical protein [Pseudomonadota bacterium]
MPAPFTPLLRVLALGLVLAAAPALGADGESAQLAEMQKKLDKSLAMIEALAKRVHELEARQTGASVAQAAPAPAATEAPRLEAVEQRVQQIETANAARRGDDTSLPIHGFADVGAGTANPFTNELKGAYVGNLDLYLTPKLGEHTLSLFELNFEVGTDGAVGVDLERAQVGYQFSDAATVWLGRFHTPFGYINTALHHGNWLSTAVRRPKFVQFEDQGGVLPAHTVGAWLTGSTHAGDGKLTYDLYAGNGQEIIGGVLDMRNAGTVHGNPMVGGRLGYKFAGALDGLTVGVHGFVDKVSDDQQPADLTRVRMLGAYAVYDTDTWEHIAEFYAFDNESLAGGTGTHRSEAGFVQLAYRLPRGAVYGRYERASLQQSDPYFAQMTSVDSGASYYRTAVGLRFDVDLKTALKLELANTHTTDRLVNDYNEAMVQYAIRF